MIRLATKKDFDEILKLYQETAKAPGGLARLENEITAEYVKGFMERSLKDGLSMVKEDQSGIVGEIHAHRPGIFCFSHVLSDLTICVSPNNQSKGFGKELFTGFLTHVKKNTPQISRIELIARESNAKAIKLYKKLGFQIEGELKNRIMNPDGALESDIPMAWQRSQA